MAKRIYQLLRNVSIHNESAPLVVGFGGPGLAFAFWKEAPRDNLQCTKSLSKTFGASFPKANASHKQRVTETLRLKMSEAVFVRSTDLPFGSFASRSASQQMRSRFARLVAQASSFPFRNSAFCIRYSKFRGLNGSEVLEWNLATYSRCSRLTLRTSWHAGRSLAQKKVNCLASRRPHLAPSEASSVAAAGAPR